MITLDELIDLVESAVGESYEKCIRFMLGCVVLVKNHLPDVGREAVEIAKKYWLGAKENPDELENARVKCWNYLDEQNASTNTQEKQYCALRAVICILYAEPPSDDISELIEFFLEMVVAVEENIDSVRDITAISIA